MRMVGLWHQAQQVIKCHERLELGFASLNPTYVVFVHGGNFGFY